MTENERQSWLSWIGWFKFVKYKTRQETCFSWKIPWVPRVGINLPFKDLFEGTPHLFSWKIPWVPRVGINLPFKDLFEGTPHLCMFGVKDPRSRRAAMRPVRFLTNSRELLKSVERWCPHEHVHGPVKVLTNAYRSSSRWHTRAWAKALIRGAESDAAKRLEVYPAQRDDGPRGGALCGKIGIHANSQKSGHASKELLCRALWIGGANKIALRAASELKRRTNLRQCHLPAKRADTKLHSIKVSEWISL